MTACLLAVLLAAPNLLRNPTLEGGLEPWAITCAREAGAGRGGGVAFRGVTDRPSYHQEAAQTVALQAGVVYELAFWARSDNQCQAVLWIELGDQRENTGRWERLPADWQRCATTFNVPRSGDWKIQFVLSSSHGNQPLGTVWACDFSLTAKSVGRSRPISPDGILADHAAAATAPDGTVYAAWEEYREDRDGLALARLDAAGQVAQRWTVDFGPRTFTLWPRLTAGPAGVWLIIAVEREAAWDIVAVPVGDGLGEPVWITSDAAADAHVAAAVDAVGLHLAWESNRDGPRRIWAASLSGGVVSEALPISGAGAYNPSVAAGGGQVQVVYDRFFGANRELCLAVQADGAWLAERRLTTSNRYDVNPAAAWWRGSLWVAWEVGTHVAYNLSSTNAETVNVARVTPAGLEATVGLEAGVPGTRNEQPGLCVDGGDRLWLAYGAARGNDGRGGWDTTLQCYTGAGWTPAAQTSVFSGRAREPAVTRSGDGVIALAQADNVPNGWASHEATESHWTRIEAVLPEVAPPPAEDLRTVAYADADDAQFKAAEFRARFGEEREPFTFVHGGRTLVARWGNFHEHSDISVCNRSGDNRTEEDYVCMREVARFDFGAVTDHCYNESAQIWRYSAKITRAADDPSRFVTFVGEEWTSNNERDTAPPGYYGHRNLIFADPYHSTWYNSRDRAYFTPRQVWDTLDGVDYIMIPHQLADAGTNVPTDWNYVHETFQPVAEIFQARESYEANDGPRRTGPGHPGYFLQDVWRRGVKIGVIASPDHGGGKGKAGVLVDALDRETILDACRARASWGTSAAKIAVAATVNGHLMGAAARRDGEPVRVHAKVSAAGPIAAVRVIRNNEVVYSHTAPGPEVSFDWLDTATLGAEVYYYLRVEQQDGELAWTSPVWLED